MTQENETPQQELEHFIRKELKWPCKSCAEPKLAIGDVFLVLALRMLDRLENIEKLLTPENSETTELGD